MTRRSLIFLAILAAGALLWAACQLTPPADPVKRHGEVQSAESLRPGSLEQAEMPLKVPAVPPH
ncbi:hypothetical protein [Jonquetella anthropi]|uniref:hypothetical protein n=1 Tax=Jonquetella anthropi TaxID=428712 RepID=UPI0001B915B5|nr:hypothetical protein [Jonquetella anthropi]EEX48625.1 hypothetical protein GCWU000246_00650 [Jonquetella anthropi E3_33 E1]